MVLKNMYRHITLLCAVLFSVALHAQNITVSGLVVDDKGEPVVGAGVVVKGTTRGASTDLEGKYSIAAPSDATLVVSFTGYATVEQPVNGSTKVNITMVEEAQRLDDVVVIGYGVARKRDLTGAVSSVRAKELAEIPVTSTAQAITGRMAGVQITTTEGSPDAEVKIRVRGGGSISQDNSPLYIVDGFPVNSISDIPPSDIQSLDVLKDASSTAIYGARGANGVVIITTKSGKEAKVSVNFNSYVGFKKITKELDVLSPYEYAAWQYELAGPSGTPANNYIKYYGVYDDMDIYKSIQGTDWQDELFGRTATTQYYNLSINGGTKATRYNLSLTRNDDEGIMIGSEYARNNLNFKLNSEVNKVISFDFNTRYSQTIVDGAGTSTGGSSSNSRLKHAVKYAPTQGMQDFVDDEDFASDIENSSTLYNPVMVTNDDYRHNLKQIFTVNGAVKFKILKSLVFRTEAGTDIGTDRNERVYGPTTSQARSDGGMPQGSIDNQNSKRWRVANTLTFDKENFLPEQNLTVLLGQELNAYSYKRVGSEARQFYKDMSASQILAMMNLGTPQPIATYESPGDNMSSYFGRINYSFKGKYLATFTLRADGSSKFAKGNQWGYFPSAALAWRISDEGFMQATSEVMNEAKIRASVGTAGNNRISDDLWRLTYVSGSGEPYFSVNDNLADAMLTPSGALSNPDLKWETTITRNLGFDLSFLNSRLNATVDLYYNTTKDLLIAATIPANTGYSTQYQNVGETSNRGVELTLDGTIVQSGGFTLRGSFNIAFNRNKVEKLNIPSMPVSSGWPGGWGPTGDYLLQEGKPVGLMYGYVTDGMYEFDDFVWNTGSNKWELKAGVADNSNLIGAKYFGPGTLRFKKLNMAGEDDYTVTAEQDKTIIGNANPKHTGGFSLTASYKGFDFSAFFNWVYGNSVYNANKLEFTSYPDSKLYGNLINDMALSNRFTIVDHANGGSFIDTDPARLQEVNKNATIWHPMMSRVVLHSWAIEDGSFLRLNNVTLGYTLPKLWTTKVFIENLRIYVTGYNLLTFTKYSGYDPEVDTRRGTPMTPNVDYSAYPRSRTFIAGINLTF